MQYSLDRIIPGVENQEIPLPSLDSIAIHSWIYWLKRLYPEISRQMFAQCSRKCDNKVCENLCPAGQAVAWGLSMIRFNVLSKYN